MEIMDDASRNSYLVHTTNDFELHDFIDEANFDQFIDLIRGENEDHVAGFHCDLIDSLSVDNQFADRTQENVFDFSATYTNSAMGLDQNYNNNQNNNVPIITLPNFDGDVKEVVEEEEDNDGEENSSGTTTRKSKTNRSRTLISERKRRGRMKEKLYELRSLVPNISKMDKASIIGDAVLYVQQLQMQAKKLRTEIAGLESSSIGSNKKLRKIQISNINNSICKKIMQMDVFQVEERGFYVRLVSNQGDGVAVSLYRTLESLTNFKIQSSNLATISEKLVLTFTLNVKESDNDMNLPNLKLWITGALLNQGFEFLTSLYN